MSYGGDGVLGESYVGLEPKANSVNAATRTKTYFYHKDTKKNK